MPPAGFQPVLPASELPYNDASDRAATGIDSIVNIPLKYLIQHS
jgi:hypothetical protein